MGNSLCMHAGDSLTFENVQYHKPRNLDSNQWDTPDQTVVETVTDSTSSGSTISSTRLQKGSIIAFSSTSLPNPNAPDPSASASLKLSAPSVDPVSWPIENIDVCKQTDNREKFLGGIKYKHHFPVKTSISYVEEIYSKAVMLRKPVILVSWHRSSIHSPLLCPFFHDVLRNPLIIEAAETLFLPIAVSDDSNSLCEKFENMSSFVHLNDSWIDGACVRILAGFSNPTKAKEKFVLNHEWNASAMAVSMSAALKLVGRPVPYFLQILGKEKFDSFLISGKVFSTKRFLYLTLNQFDPGETFFADIDGVIALRSGRIDGCKVIQIAYDSNRISFSKIVQETIQRKMTKKIYYQNSDERIAICCKLNHDSHFEICRLNKFVEDNDSKHALRKTPLRYVPLTEMQCALVNKYIFECKFNEAMHLLSPRQGMILSRLFRSNLDGICDAIDVPIYCAWSELIKIGFFDTRQ